MVPSSHDPQHRKTVHDQKSSQVQALFDQALALHQRGSIMEARRLYQAVLRIDPTHFDSIHLLGVTCLHTGQPAAAATIIGDAIRINPNFALAHNNLGNALSQLGKIEEALGCFARALALKHDYADAYTNRGNALRALERYDDALASYDQALLLEPSNAEAHSNRGNLLGDLKRIDEAMACYERAIALKPDYADAHWNKALLLLLKGEYRAGWEKFEWRLKREETRAMYPDYPQPAWRGQRDIAGRTLLIHSEQGLGDVIHFCRYLEDVARLGAKIIFEVPASLVPFVGTLRCPLTIVAKGESLPAFDAYCPVMSLPFAFGTTIDTVTSRVPYLSSDPFKVAQWQQRLGTRDRMRVGLAWSGASTHQDDAKRSMKLEGLLPLLDLPIEWHSLQREYRPSDLDLLQRCPGLRQHQDRLEDFSATAALIECLDLVITVDTSVAHVAAAMGKPVWIMLAFVADYRWLLDRDDSPWYPSVRLFRQPKIGDWHGVVSRVAAELGK